MSISTCAKQSYPSRKLARKAVRALRTLKGRELRHYRCARCQMFHLTSMGAP